MAPLIASLVGLCVGIVSWEASQRLAVHYRTQGDADAGWLTTSHLFSVPGIVAVTAPGLWAGYVCREGIDGPRATGLLLVTTLLLVMALVDLAVRRIPNVLVLALVAWCVAQPFWIGRPDFRHMCYGLALGGGVFLLVALVGRGALGAGDVKLAAALGGLVGYPVVLAALFCGVAAGGLAAVLLLLTRRAGRKDFMPYGPFLILGGYVIWTRFLGFWP